MLRLGWFSTGRGEGSRGLLNYVQGSIQSGELKARIGFVFSNREPGEAEGSDQFFQLVRGYGLPIITLSSSRFRRERGGGPFARHRADFDRQVLRLLEDFKPDLCVLAGYMLIVGPEMCRRYDMLNLHPALPGGPVGTWQSVIWQLIEREARETGVMIHLATETVDQGPVVAYCTFPIVGGAYDGLWNEIKGRTLEDLRTEEGEDLPLFRLIRQEGLKRERPLLLETLKAVAEGLIGISRGRVLDSRGQPVKPLLLNTEIEGRLAMPLP